MINVLRLRTGKENIPKLQEMFPSGDPAETKTGLAVFLNEDPDKALEQIKNSADDLKELGWYKELDMGVELDSKSFGKTTLVITPENLELLSYVGIQLVITVYVDDKPFWTEFVIVDK